MFGQPLVLAIGGDLPVKVLAVVGAFTVGGLLLGWMFQAVVKTAFAQKTPPWMNWLVRGLSGLLVGWLAALWLFGPGGGMGGPGGFGVGGSGSEKENDKSGRVESRDKTAKDNTPVEQPDLSKDKGKDGSGIGVGETIRVEVLGDSTLRKVATAGKIDPERRFRLADAPEKLLTLNQVRELISQRRRQKDPLRRLVVILYRDSPDRNTPLVSELIRWSSDLEDTGNGKFMVDVTELDRNAPTR